MRVPPPTVNLTPKGLLGFFGIKNGGRNPDLLRSDLLPTVELWKLYAETNAIYSQSPLQALPTGTVVGGTINIPATQAPDLGNGTAIAVPENEVWYLDKFVVKWVLDNAADVTTGFWPAFYQAQNQIALPLACTAAGNLTGAATPGRTGWASMIDPMFLQPGNRIAAYHGGYTSGAVGSITLQIGLRFCRMQQ